MPTYAYACTACGHAFDAVQKFSDSALTECPECGGRLRKVYTSIGVTFKGSVFYRNDSRASSKPSEKSSEKAPSEKSGDASKATSEKSSSPSTSGSASGTSSSTSSGASSGSTAAAS